MPGLSWNNRRGIIDNQLRQLCCRRWLSNKPEAVISRTNLAKSPDYSYYNILGQLCKHVLSQFVKGITEYSMTNFRSGTPKLACYFSYIPACVVVAMQRHQIIYYDGHVFSIDLILKLTYYYDPWRRINYLVISIHEIGLKW